MKKFVVLTAALFTLSASSNAQNVSPYWSLSGNSNATSSSKFGTTKNISLRFYTNNLQRMIINSSAGLVGIGTISPDCQLHINSPAGLNPLRVQVNGATRLFVHSGGGVSIGSNATAPINGLHVAGNVEIGTNTIPGGTLDVYARSINTAVDATADSGIGVSGRAFLGVGVAGFSATAYGVTGTSPEGTGMKASGQVYGIEASGDVAGVNCFSTDGFGIQASSNTSAGITASTNTGTYAAEFNGKVFASSGYVVSDKRLKRNFQQLGNAMAIIGQLKPLKYEFTTEVKYQFLHLPKGRHYGLMAQDIELILPDLVSEGKHITDSYKPAQPVKSASANATPALVPPLQQNESVSIKAVNYIELIPVIIRGMQEQQIQIDKLTEQNKALQKQIEDLKSLRPTTAALPPATS